MAEWSAHWTRNLVVLGLCPTLTTTWICFKGSRELKSLAMFVNNQLVCLQPVGILGRRGGLMVSALVSGSSNPDSSPGWGHCVVYLGRTLCSHSASL